MPIHPAGLRRVVRAAAPGLLAAVLLAASVPWWRQDLDRAWAHQRFWADLHLAVGYALHGQFPVVAAHPDEPFDHAGNERFRRELLLTAWGARITASHPWLPKRIMAIRAFADSSLYRKHVGLGDDGLSMEQVDEKVHEIIRVLG